MGMRRRGRAACVAGSWLLAVLAMGCVERRSPKTVIAVLPKGTSHEFWKSIHAGALKEAENHGVEILWSGPLREDARAEQVKVVENAINSGVQGIVLAPMDNKALVAPAEEARREGIPVVIIDSGLDWDGMVSFVATDNFKGGEMGAEHLGTLLEGKGKAILMRYQVGSASTHEREEGFLKVMAERYPGIELLSTNQYAGASVASAQKVGETLLSRHPDVGGIFCPNESATFGMLRALQEGGLAGKVIFVGFDGTEILARALENGEIHGLVLQNPFRMGELGVRVMMDHLAGKSVEKRIDTGVTVATRENMNDPAIKELLTPDLSQWLKSP